MPNSFDIIALARMWIGTPYQHQASCIGAGVDCLGLVRGVYRMLYGQEPAVPPPYPRFAASDEGELVWDTARLYLDEIIPCSAPQSGQVLLFRMRRGVVARHLAIATDMGQMVHAASESAVCEVTLSDWWRRRHVASFDFPELNK